ncbi:hypothetical protein D3C81_1160130 [compost metagenome]
MEPGWRRACATWSKASTVKSRLPTQARMAPVDGSSAMKPACTRVFCWRSACMKARSAKRRLRASSSLWPPATAARNSGVSRTKACTSTRLSAQPARGAQAALAIDWSWLPWRVTAWLAMAWRRESMVVWTTSPSV